MHRFGVNNRTIVLMVLVACFLAAAVFAQQAEKPSKPTEVKYTEIKYSADSSHYRWQGDDKIAVLTGNVKFVQGDTTLLADKVEYHEKTKTATASGSLKIYDPQNTLTGDLCTVNFDEKKGTLSGNVRLVAKPKPKDETRPDDKSLKSEWKDEATITCDKVDYWYKQKKAVIPGPLKIVQKSRVVTADSAVYLGKEEKVELEGNVKGVDEKEKHTFAAPSVVISFKEDDEWVEARKATGTFYVKEEEEQKEPAEPVQQPGTGTSAEQK